MRLFVGIPLENTTKEWLVEVQRAIMPHLTRGTLTSRSNFHLTLAFLGEVSEEGAKELIQIFKSLSHPSFQLGWGGLGVFEKRKGQVVWVGVQKQLLLEALQEKVAEALKRGGFEMEDLPFVPHITLARNVRWIDEMRGSKLLIPVNQDPESVSKFVLYHSCRGKEGLVYESMESFRLIAGEEAEFC